MILNPLEKLEMSLSLGLHKLGRFLKRTIRGIERALARRITRLAWRLKALAVRIDQGTKRRAQESKIRMFLNNFYRDSPEPGTPDTRTVLEYMDLSEVDPTEEGVIYRRVFLPEYIPQDAATCFLIGSMSMEEAAAKLSAWYMVQEREKLHKVPSSLEDRL